MKKSYKFLLLIFLLCPLMILTACKAPEYYGITVSYSDAKFGSVEGVPNKEVADGSTLTLKAIENWPKEHPFIGWVHDEKRIVGLKNKIDIGVSESTQGNYTALFEEENIQYATFSSIEFNLPSDVESVTFDVKYSKSKDGTDNDILLYENKTIKQDEEFVSDNKDVFFFGTPGKFNLFMFTIEAVFTYTDAVSPATTITFDALTQDGFDKNGNIKLVDKGDHIFTIVLNKVSKKLYSAE